MRKWRTEQGLTQGQAARLVKLGKKPLSQASWARIENGLQAPTIAVASAISLATRGVVAVEDHARTQASARRTGTDG